MDSSGFLLYEFPCNEKVRMLLRLESLFARFDWFCEQASPIASHAAINALFDLVDASARSDLRNELLRELEHSRATLVALRGNAEVNQQALEESIGECMQTMRDINRVIGRSGQAIRDNEWLQLVRTRQSIPGGTCVFDMPMLHYWLSQPAASRQSELRAWGETLTPLKHAVFFVLRHLRSSTQESWCTASGGMYQLSMTGKSYALARIWLPEAEMIIPEVSANKYMLWIRFSRPDERRRLHAAQERVSFRLGLCA